MLDKVPIKFEHDGKQYEGFFELVSGSGSSFIWHLMIDKFYCGRLSYTDSWVYHGNSFDELGDFFGDYITAWYQ